jgi:hypothetical protein
MNLKAFAISERQWPRSVRVAHYQAQLAAAPNKLAAKHWRRLLAMNGAK